MTNTYRVTLRAKKDLQNIGRYTMKIWGKKQRDVYLLALDRQFARLAEHPNHGRHRPDVQMGYYSFAQGSHIIFYLVRDGGIDIIGIPHQRMDITHYFF